MNPSRKITLCLILPIITLGLLGACQNNQKSMLNNRNKKASEILGNSNYPAICYGGYRHVDRNIEPTREEVKEDVLIMSALGFKVIRTYNVFYQEATHLLSVIKELKESDPNFEMYVMLGAWIDCKNPRTDSVNHNEESELNQSEIEKAIKLTKEYPDIVKIIAVGNEAMVHWATSYFVQPSVILKWVDYLQELKKTSELPSDLWVTSSDNFASWGGGGAEYHKPELNKLIQAVDYISIHTYPMHDTHYNPAFWGVDESEADLSDTSKIQLAINRSVIYAANQYKSVLRYLKSLGIKKEVHIGETGWASYCNGLYGHNGSKAVDEYKSGLYYKAINNWAKNNGVSCFYFEAFDEPWKDGSNPGGSENHFGLIDIEGSVKFAIWDQFDKGNLKGLTRNGEALKRSHISLSEISQLSLVPRMISLHDSLMEVK